MGFGRGIGGPFEYERSHCYGVADKGDRSYYTATTLVRQRLRLDRNNAGIVRVRRRKKHNLCLVRRFVHGIGNRANCFHPSVKLRDIGYRAYLATTRSTGSERNARSTKLHRHFRERRRCRGMKAAMFACNSNCIERQCQPFDRCCVRLGDIPSLIGFVPATAPLQLPQGGLHFGWRSLGEFNSDHGHSLAILPDQSGDGRGVAVRRICNLIDAFGQRFLDGLHQEPAGRLAIRPEGRRAERAVVARNQNCPLDASDLGALQRNPGTLERLARICIQQTLPERSIKICNTGFRLAGSLRVSHPSRQTSQALP